MSRSLRRGSLLAIAFFACFRAFAATGHPAMDPPTSLNDRGGMAGVQLVEPVPLDPLQLMIMLHLNGARDLTLRSIPQPADRACCETTAVSN